MLNHRVKRHAGALLAAGLALFGSTAVLAKQESSHAITTPIEVYVRSVDIQPGMEGGTVDVEVSGDHCSLDYAEVVEPTDQWAGGDVPRVEIYIAAEDDYYFSKAGSGMFKISGVSKPRYSSSSRQDDETIMHLTIKLEELEFVKSDFVVSDVKWSGGSGTGRWEELNQAKSYQVKLYRNGDELSGVASTTNNSYDFSSRLTRRGDYTFAVRPVDYGNNKGEWVESGVYYVSSSDADDFYDDNRYNYSSGRGNSSGPGMTGHGRWILDNVGWWYENYDRSYTQNGWQQIDGYWYFFNGTGYMQTGWILWNSKWYYCDLNTGAMWHDATTPDGYRVDSSGAWIH